MRDEFNDPRCVNVVIVRFLLKVKKIEKEKKIKDGVRGRDLSEHFMRIYNFGQSRHRAELREMIASQYETEKFQ